MDVVVGVDLGGTKIEAVALQVASKNTKQPIEYSVIARKRIPTEQHRGYKAIVENVGAIVSDVTRQAGVGIQTVPIGIGMPGSFTRRDGVVKNSNTVCLNGKPFREDVRTLLGRSVICENDANCFALAESWFGAANPWKDGVVFGVIMGTGVGGGLVLSGRLWSGVHNIAGEWGHHAVFFDRDDRCYCGKNGCLELYVSGPSVEREYQKLTGNQLELKTIAQRYHADNDAKRVMDRLLLAFGRGIANVIDILDPSVIVLGGGVSNVELLYSLGRESVARYLFNDELLTPIVQHQLGDSAGVLGAALLGYIGKT